VSDHVSQYARKGTRRKSVSNPDDFGPYSHIEVVRVKQIYDSFDLDGSGSVSLKEFINCAAWRQAYSSVQLIGGPWLPLADCRPTSRCGVRPAGTCGGNVPGDGQGQEW
jgi:hypothetical protein